eukprot:SAG22_NODE_7846_length_702_cov_1.864013_1_plen_171_part_00
MPRQSRRNGGHVPGQYKKPQHAGQFEPASPSVPHLKKSAKRKKGDNSAPSDADTSGSGTDASDGSDSDGDEDNVNLSVSPDPVRSLPARFAPGLHASVHFCGSCTIAIWTYMDRKCPCLSAVPSICRRIRALSVRRSGFKNEINYVHQLKSKPGSLARIKDIPAGSPDPA